MSKLKDMILDQDDLSKVLYPVEQWVNQATGESVVVELRSPSVRRRQQIMKQYQTRNTKTGEVEIDLVDLQMALLFEMVFDPEPEKGEEDEPLFCAEDVERLEAKNGVAVWELAQECLRVAGFVERESDESVGAEQALVNEGKD